MDQFIAKILEHFQHVTWEGPAAFVAVLVVVFAFLRRWSLVLLIMLTVVLGWGAEDMIILNLTTQDQIVSVPLLVYLVGSVTIVILAFFSLFGSK